MSEQPETRECPYCKEHVKSGAIRCKYCKSAIQPETPGHEGTCPFCKETIKSDAIKCRYCHSNLVSNSVEEPCRCREVPRSLNDRLMRRLPLIDDAFTEVCDSTGTLWCADMLGVYRRCGWCIPAPGPWLASRSK